MARSKRAQRRRRSRHARKARGAQSGRSSRRRKVELLFSSTNYLLMLIGIVAVICGYALMRIENEVDGVISLYVAPLLILGGYLQVIYAILWRPKAKPSAASHTADT